MAASDTLLLLRLVLAHILGDFILQPKSWVKDREKHKHKSKRLYQHALLHAVLTYALAGSWQSWYIPVVVFLTHAAIDIAKSSTEEYCSRKCKAKANQKEEGLTRKWHPVLFFIADQAAHLIVLYSLWYAVTGGCIDISTYTWKNEIFMSRLLIYTIATAPTSIFIRTFINAWKPQNNSGVENAGKWIGYIERVLVISFVIWGKYEAVGFLLAAKSVFRIGDMKDKEHRDLTEYILVGTLLSFGAAILLGFAATYYFK